MCSGKQIAANSWCSGEPDDQNSPDERDLMANPAKGFCLFDGIKVRDRHYMCKQGKIIFLRPESKSYQVDL